MAAAASSLRQLDPGSCKKNFVDKGWILFFSQAIVYTKSFFKRHLGKHLPSANLTHVHVPLLFLFKNDYIVCTSVA